MRLRTALLFLGFCGAGLVYTVASLTMAANEPKTPPHYDCLWAKTPITLDGQATEVAWMNATPIQTFSCPETDGKPAKEATRAKLLWDRDYLYLHADMDDADLNADAAKPISANANCDAISLFVRPSRDHEGYFEFTVTAANTVRAAFYPKRDPAALAQSKDQNNDFHLLTKVVRKGTLNKHDDTDTGWQLECRIPWSDFLRAGGRPELGETWAFALGRTNTNQRWKEPEHSATVPFTTKKADVVFHQTDRYSPIVFKNPGADGERLFGLPKRVPLTTSTVVGSPDPPTPYRTVRLYPNLSPSFPVAVNAIPGTDQLLYITETSPYSPTTVWRVKDDPAVKTDEAVKLFETPTGGVSYDFCFHPKFAENGYVYFGWNGSGKGVHKNMFSRVTRYTMNPKPPYTLDVNSAKTIIEWESNGHNGAAVCFGKDGYLYVTSGDGTADSDRDVMGQSTHTLLAKVLRIDVNREENGKAYAIPKDNPFADGKEFAPETWATGTRNPWRICCDEKTGRIWIGNNGQDLWETAHLVKPRDNYGWSIMEGSHVFYESRKKNPLPLTPPTIEHHHSEFRSLTGGLVYYGKELPELNGVYIYGDYSTGRIWGMKHDGTKVLMHKELASPRFQITSFGKNTRGELLISDHRNAGQSGFYTLAPNTEAAPSNFPRKLSESGLFDNVPKHIVKPGVIPYSVNATFWSDGMHKERYLAIPDGGKIDYTHSRGWNFPDRTVIIKSFAHESEEGNPETRKWIETRFLTKQAGEWFGYTYKWNDAGTDAELLGSAGIDQEYTTNTANGIIKQVWRYPSRAECMVCHSRAANFALGLCEVQMNKDHDYGSGPCNQLRALEYLGLLKLDAPQGVSEAIRKQGEAKGLKDKTLKDFIAQHGPQPNQRQPKSTSLVAQAPADYKRLVDPYDKKQDLTLRAKSWLHANCSSCHVEAGGGNAQMEMELTTALADMRILDVKPMHHNFDIPEARLIAPGHPEASVILRRISTRGQRQMPPLASTRIDTDGVALITEWIASLKK